MANAQILVVEDEVIVAKDIQNTLKNLGYAVPAVVSSGEEAIKKAAETHPELVLMDIVLEGAIDGVEAAGHIRNHFDIPVVYLTAYSDEKTLQRAKITEPYGYILKPFQERELHTTIEMALYKHKMERQLRESEKKYRQLIENAQEGIWTLDIESKITLVNARMAEMLGYSVDEMLGRSVFSFMDESGVAVAKRCLETVKQGGKGRCDLELFRKDGDRIYTSRSCSPIIADGANCIGVFSFVSDVTERKQAEETIDRLARQNELILNSAGEGIFGLDLEGNTTFVNPAAARLFGWEAEELVGRATHTILHHSKPDGTPYLQEDCPTCDVLRKGTTCHVDDEVFWRKDGTSFPVEYISNPILEQGEIVGAVVTFNDITERKRSQEEHVRLATAIEQAGESVIITDRAGTIQYVNPALEHVSGYTRQEIVGHNVRILDSGKHDEGFYRTMWDVLGRGEMWSGHIVNKKKDGSLYEVEATISPTRDKSGTIISYVAVQRDVTHEVILERKLRQAQKMEAIGTLAGGIAHDFNNILGAIIGYAELAKLHITQGSPANAKLDQTLKAANRAKELVRQILTFSRQSEQEPKALQISLVVKEALKLIRATLPTTIEIRQNIKKESGMVLADPTQMHQVVMNLCTNAAHAMLGKGGELEVSVVNVDLDATSVVQYPGMKPGRYVRLTVSDTGHGMDHEAMSRIFEPYFTTKEKGVGTGLGLAVVHGIVQSCGGRIVVYSEPGKGTTFHICLPRIDVKAGEATEPLEALPKGNERIMFVDDEETLRNVAQEMLEYLGYKVVVKPNGTEALETFRSQPDGFDLIITDQTMPHMTGEMLARELLRIKPDIPIILCTGYSAVITEKKAKGVGIREFVMKPLVLRDLAVTVRRVVDKG